MTQVLARSDEAPLVPSVQAPRGLVALVSTRDHKRIGLMIVATALVLLFAEGAIAMVIRAQLSRPGQDLVSAKVYDELFTAHGAGMIYLVLTPIALGIGVYLVPLQVGSPFLAAPRLALLGYWLYVAGAICMNSGYLTGNGGGGDGWYSYPPLSGSVYTPGEGMTVWVAGVFVTAVAMVLLSGCVLWTALRLRAPGVTLLRLPVFTWSMIVSCLMSVMAFPSLMAAMGLLIAGRVHPAIFDGKAWDIAYQNIFWFYGHPVVYIIFFPFVGCVAEVLACFSGHRYNGYKPTVFSLLLFAALSMSVWGHHMLTTGQVSNDYFSFTSIMLSIPAGIEYFGFVTTVLGGRLRFTTAMLFALGFVPMFLIGGLSGIMLGTPVIDYMEHGSYFVVAHFHYTLFGGSAFGLFAGLYFWWPKATGWRLGERLGQAHFWTMLIGANMTYMPMFIMAFYGMSRRQRSYPDTGPLDLLNAISSAGAAVLAVSFTIFAFNVVLSYRARRPQPDDPWGAGQALEWATSSPPPLYNFTLLPPVESYAPLLDLREHQEDALHQAERAVDEEP